MTRLTYANLNGHIKYRNTLYRRQSDKNRLERREDEGDTFRAGDELIALQYLVLYLYFPDRHKKHKTPEEEEQALNIEEIRS